MRAILSLAPAALILSCGTPQADPTLSQLPATAVPAGADGSIGTLGNPVRARGPFGEEEYLARTRCPDSTAVAYQRLGSRRGTADQHQVDIYVVHCPPAGPTVEVIMDMYHDHRETSSVGPFTVLADLPAKLATGCPPRVLPSADSSARYVFTAFEVERPARLVATEPPAYRAGFEGTAFVKYIVDTSGIPEPTSIEILHLEPTKGRSHVPAALAALRFDPALHHAGCLVRQWSEGVLLFR